MATTRKTRVPMTEQIRLINECRQSGMTDADWCRENDIAVSTFYNWVSRCRKVAADQIPAPSYAHCEIPRSKQDVVPIPVLALRIYAEAYPMFEGADYGFRVLMVLEHIAKSVPLAHHRKNTQKMHYPGDCRLFEYVRPVPG